MTQEYRIRLQGSRLGLPRTWFLKSPCLDIQPAKKDIVLVFEYDALDEPCKLG